MPSACTAHFLGSLLLRPHASHGAMTLRQHTCVSACCLPKQVDRPHSAMIDSLQGSNSMLGLLTRPHTCPFLTQSRQQAKACSKPRRGGWLTREGHPCQEVGFAGV